MPYVEIKTWCNENRHGSSKFVANYPDMPTAMEGVKAEIEVGLQAVFEEVELRDCTDFSVTITGGVNEL